MALEWPFLVSGVEKYWGVVPLPLNGHQINVSLFTTYVQLIWKSYLLYFCRLKKWRNNYYMRFFKEGIHFGTTTTLLTVLARLWRSSSLPEESSSKIRGRFRLKNSLRSSVSASGKVRPPPTLPSLSVDCDVFLELLIDTFHLDKGFSSSEAVLEFNEEAAVEDLFLSFLFFKIFANSLFTFFFFFSLSFLLDLGFCCFREDFLLGCFS